MRLLRWCRFIAPGDLLGVFSKSELQNLVGGGFIKLHTRSGAYTLSGKGQKLLDNAFDDGVQPNTQLSYRDSDIQRRLNLAKLTLTAYRAGASVFTNSIEDLKDAPSIFLPSNTRGRGSNPWANTRIAAVAHLGDTVFAVHHVRTDSGKMLLTDELAAFIRNTTPVKTERFAFLFIGDSYPEILSELDHRENKEGDRLISYGEAYRQLRLPAHLVAFGEIGALQMAVMAQPDYRRRLTKIALRTKFKPAPAEYSNCDAFYDGAPFLLAADMDLRRIDTAIQTAHERGGEPVVLAALAGQAEAVLYARYRDTGLARVFRLTDSALSEFFGVASPLYTPSHEQFLTAKGGVIDAPLIQTHRKD